MIYNLIKYYFSLHYWQRASLESVKKMQLKKFREIFEYARENSKFYRELYTKHGVMDLKIKSFEDIKKIPIVTKLMFKEYESRDIVTCEIDNKVNLHTTSGSSGEPLKVYFDKFADYSSHTRVFFALRKIASYNPFKKIMLITRYEESDNFQVESDLSILKKMQNFFGLFNREIISIYRDVDYMIERISKSKPYILWSTPSVIEIVANRLAEKGISLNIPYLYFTSEHFNQIQFEKFKKYISDNIIDIYGSMESPCLGFELNKSGERTVYPNSNLFEIINERDFGGQRVGDVIITNLINYTMPIIRYDLKDLCEIKEDKNIPHKYISPIIGRIDDILQFPDGKQFVHHHAHEMFMDFEECEQFKFLQKDNGPIVLQLKPNKRFSNDFIKEKAYQRWNKRFSQYILEIEFVEKFEINPTTGKFKNIEKIK
ncbi:MAG TPA: hypothetical protein PLY32_00130 [Salinivirgaceae bacterium]|nr:hypothetical protein [Salinivirgaceae bacterium]HQA75502.1 hypothetical protein [Salinivirgaceae bacterium]